VFSGMCVRYYNGQFSIYPLIDLLSVCTMWEHINVFLSLSWNVVYFTVLYRKRMHGLLFITIKVLPGFGNTRDTRVPREVSGLHGLSFRWLIIHLGQALTMTYLFACSLHHPKIPIVHPQSQQESPAAPTQESQSISKLSQELRSSWRTIKQLQSLDPFESPVRRCSSHTSLFLFSLDSLILFWGSVAEEYQIFVQSLHYKDRLCQRLVLSWMLPLQTVHQRGWKRILVQPMWFS
jgi:hypothetical protein